MRGCVEFMQAKGRLRKHKAGYRGVFDLKVQMHHLGGWCAKRGYCPHYHAEDRAEPIERLCHPGRDGEAFEYLVGQPIEFTRSQPVRVEA